MPNLSTNNLKKIPGGVWALAMASTLILPRLGAFGLWDPTEILHADTARNLAESPHWQDITNGGKFLVDSPLYVYLVALGFKFFGINELAGRLPLALCGIAGALLTYYIVRRLYNQTAALLSTAVLVTTPLYLLQSRQLISDLPLLISALAAVGGMLCYLWPANGTRCKSDLVLAGFGLVAGFLAKGFVLGFLTPIAAVALAVLVAQQVRNTSNPAYRCVSQPGKHLGDADTVWQATRSALASFFLVIGISLGVCTVIWLALRSNTTLNLWWPAQFRILPEPPTLETVFKDLAHGLFPWIAVLPLMISHFALSMRDEAQAEGGDGNSSHRDSFLKIAILCCCLIGYISTHFWSIYVTPTRFAMLPWISIGLAIFIHDVAVSKTRRPLWGLVAAGIILLLQQDFWANPNELAFSHLVSGNNHKFPVDVDITAFVRIFGLTLPLFAYIALSDLPQPIPTWSKLTASARYAALGGSMIFTVLLAWWIVPQLSLHLSNKALFETYKRCRTSDAQRLAQYRVSGRGAAYYNNGQVDEVATQDELFKLLRSPSRTFVLLPSNEIGAIDQSARMAGVSYFVLDDRSSTYLILSNQLSGSCAEDHNPLRRFVSKQRPAPKHTVEANFENRVKLIGYDAPDTVTRGGKLPITLYFEVLDSVPAGYKLFIHFDQPAARFHGDHEPLGGKYPTQYWLKGDYITDKHEIDLPILTTSGGTYQIYMGFWRGDDRLKVTQGPNDGVNRVLVGRIVVR